MTTHQRGCVTDPNGIVIHWSAEIAIRAPVLQHDNDLSIDAPCRLGIRRNERALINAVVVISYA